MATVYFKNCTSFFFFFFFVFFAWKIHGQRGLAGYSPWGHKRIRHDLATKQQQQKPSKILFTLTLHKF